MNVDRYADSLLNALLPVLPLLILSYSALAGAEMHNWDETGLAHGLAIPNQGTPRHGPRNPTHGLSN